jgi:hypothetical protein
MPRADQKMLNFSGDTAVPWEHFSEAVAKPRGGFEEMVQTIHNNNEAVAERYEHRFLALDMRGDDRLRWVHPQTTAVVIWTETLLGVMNNAATC